MLLFWESGGEGQKLGTYFGFEYMALINDGLCAGHGVLVLLRKSTGLYLLKVVPFYARAEVRRAGSGANMTIDNAAAMRKEV